MYELKILSEFAAAHQLREFSGSCERLHGHNWKVEVHVTGEDTGDNGLVLDFREIKEATKKTLEEMDHRFLNDLPAFQEKNPSSENIARLIFDTLSARINRPGVRVSKVTAWESDSAAASYLEP